MDPLELLPTTLHGGETIAVEIIVSGYLPSTHTLAYQFTHSSALTVTAAANQAGTGWNLIVPATETVKWAGGLMRFVGLATRTADSVVTAVDEGSIAITVSPFFVAWATTALAAIEAAITGRATDAQKRVGVGDLTVEGMTLDELMKARIWLQAESRKAQRGGTPKRIILSRFT